MVIFAIYTITITPPHLTGFSVIGSTKLCSPQFMKLSKRAPQISLTKGRRHIKLFKMFKYELRYDLASKLLEPLSCSKQLSLFGDFSPKVLAVNPICRCYSILFFLLLQCNVIINQLHID